MHYYTQYSVLYHDITSINLWMYWRGQNCTVWRAQSTRRESPEEEDNHRRNTSVGQAEDGDPTSSVYLSRFVLISQPEQLRLPLLTHREEFPQHTDIHTYTDGSVCWGSIFVLLRDPRATAWGLLAYISNPLSWCERVSCVVLPHHNPFWSMA